MQKFPEIKKDLDTGKLYINVSHIKEKISDLNVKIDQRIRKFDINPADISVTEGIKNDVRKVELMLVKSWINEVISEEGR
jgi:hypothetical protein